MQLKGFSVEKKHKEHLNSEETNHVNKCPSKSSCHLLLLEAKMLSCKVPHNHHFKGNWQSNYYLVFGEGLDV